MNVAFIPTREEHVEPWVRDLDGTWLADGFARLEEFLAKHLAFARFLERRGR